MTQSEILEHDESFSRAKAITVEEIIIRGKPNHSDLSSTRDKLEEAVSLFKRVLALNSENWQAMWYIGKIHQRFGDNAAALPWFEQAYQFNPSHTDVAREAAICSMETGHLDKAIVYAHRTTQIEPTNAGLHANLGVAYLLAGRIAQAQASLDRSLTLDPSDSISQTLKTITQHFAANGQKPPTSGPELEKYWIKNRSR